jgi:hypothetical protein
MSFYNKYINFAYTYGILRKFSYIYGTSYYLNDKETKFLISDYCLMCNLAGCKSIFLSPIYLLNDIKHTEIKIRNLNYNNFITNKDKSKKSYCELFHCEHLNLLL